MEKNVAEKDVYYKITWSKQYECNRHVISGIPVLPGIVDLYQENKGVITPLLFYACWKSGIRIGIRNLLDPNFSLFPELIKLSEDKNLLFRYSVIDTHFLDMKDILYWLIREYSPELNNAREFKDSERYKDIYLKEIYENA
ncbi:MAG: hypothetical protein JW864_18240 [Spirochaetes bacterium]|nr:hypothetical protein [Spirochaetota bacterium]